MTDIKDVKTTAKTPPKPAIIEATSISQSFGEEGVRFMALQEVSFKILHNSFTVIYGPSGSGKSTLLNILTGLQPPTTGKIVYNNQNIYDLDSDSLAQFRASRIGIIYQQNYWVKSLSVVENVALPLFFRGYNRALAKELALISLERVRMQDYASKNPTLLSGGEQQRVAVARALVNDPMIIIADEPTGSLDSKNGDLIMDLLHKAQTESMRTIILVTHNMEYLPLANHLLHIQDGKVQELQAGSIQATVDGLMTDMKQRIDRLSVMNQKKGQA